jgi:hypothetical protein
MKRHPLQKKGKHSDILNKKEKFKIELNELPCD